MEDTKQVLELTDEKIKEMIESGEIVVDESTQAEDIIPFDLEVIAAHEEYSQSNAEEYDKGISDVSRYVGQFHTLINAGINSETATLIMSWIRESKLNKDTLDAQVEMAKIADIKVQQASL